MGKKLFVFFIRAIYLRIKKRGFTLAEALIITVMTGACLLPIMGTMQNAQVRTEIYDHQAKMQQYARSRLTEEIANAAFDHKSIDLEDEYHYIVFFDEDNKENEAKKIELSKTSINLADLKYLNQKKVKDNWSEEACRLFGIVKTDNDNTPYLKVVHAYKTSVETKDNPQLAVFDSDIESEDDEEKVDTPQALMGIVVRTTLLESDDNLYSYNGYLLVASSTGNITDEQGAKYVEDETIQVAPVSLFSFVNLPAVSNELIWLADASNWRLHYLDPIGKTAVAVDLPKTYGDYSNSEEFKPYHVAIHPSLKFLVYQTSEHLIVMNIDRNSPSYKSIYRIGGSQSSENIGEGGICFRHDGQFLFVADKNKKLTVYEFEWKYETGKKYIKWNPGSGSEKYPKITEKISADLDTQAVSGLIPANDGFLYIAQQDQNNIIRTPMYPTDFDSELETEKVITLNTYINSIDVSPDGQMLAVVASDGRLLIYNTRDKDCLANGDIKKEGKFSLPFKCAFVANSSSGSSDKNLNVFVTNKNLKSGGDYSFATAFNVTNNKAIKAKSIELTENLNIGGGFAVASPDNQSVVVSDITDRYSYFFSSDASTPTSRNLSTYDGSVHELNGKKITDLAASKRDVLAVGKTDKYIDLYNLNNYSKLEESYYASDTISTLAMNPQGDMLISGHAAQNNVTGSTNYWFGKSDSSGKTGDYANKKIVFDDRTPNMSFSLVSTGKSFYNLNDNNSDWDDTFSSEAYNRRSFALSSDWVGKDIIGLPKGGAMALYGKSDGSSMVEWIGRINWGASDKKGLYRLFARWTNMKDSSLGGSKTIPNFSLNKCVINGVGNIQNIGSKVWEHDNWKGRIEIIKNIELPVNGKVVSLNYKKSGWPIPGSYNSSNEENRYITPLLLEKQPDGNFKIKDYGESIEFSKNDYSNTITTKVISWQKGDGVIKNSIYRLGFWNGNLGETGENSKSKGPIPYYMDDNNYTYVADYYIKGHGSGEHDGLKVNDITNADIVVKEYNDNSKKRNYALSFNIESSFHDSFPPLYSKKLALSPDYGTLAVLSGVNQSTYSANENYLIPKVSLYDFNNQIYGQETQLEGMLVDYRKQLTGNLSVWPKETESLFKEVKDQTNFQPSDLSNESDKYPNIPTFASATTKFDSWESFNAHPFNYYIISYYPEEHTDNINNSKEYSFKRFFGYYRPESDVNYLQTYSSEFIRFFLNGSYLLGRKETNLQTSSFSSSYAHDPISLQIKRNDSALLQMDEVCNGGGSTSDILGANVFVSSEDNLNDITIDTERSTNDSNNPTTNYLKIKNGKSFDFINSAQTYILKNQPSFIGSFEAVTGSVKLNVDSSSMIFSRDRAKPVLYIAGTTYLWALYKNTLIRTTQTEDGSIKTNLAISSDGQKLIYGKVSSDADSKMISFFDISKPDETKFINATAHTIAKSVSEFSNSYLTNVKDLYLDSEPAYLATKPHNSYSSSIIGGEYREISKPILTNFNSSYFTNGSMAVASGGIYIYDGDKSIICYNPITEKIEKFDNALKKKSPNAPMASYDDKLYIFGNAGSAGDNLSGRVQSYDINNKETMTSLGTEGVVSKVGYDESYQVSMGISTNLSENNYPSNFGVSSGIYSGISGYITANNLNHVVHAFDSVDTDWANIESNDAWINIWFDIPLTVNRVSIYSKNNSAKKFELEGSSDDFAHSETIWSKTLTSTSPQNTVDTDKEGTFNKYQFHIKDGYGGLISLIQLWRTGVKRLTPPLKNPQSEIKDEQQQSLKWQTPKITTIMKWSTNTGTSYSLKDVFTGNSTDNNNWIKNSSTQGWNTSVSKPWITVSLSTPEALCAVRYANDNSSAKIKTIRLYGSNNSTCPVPDDDSLPETGSTDWIPLEFTNGIGEFSGPVVDDYTVDKTFITAEVDNNTKYSHYLFQVKEKDSTSALRLIGFEMFSKPATNDEQPSKDYLTPMKDDNFNEVMLYKNAVCSTPYGLVIAGGHNGTNAQNTALLYWPHAINKYDGQYYQYGISKSLPSMNTARYGHALVWHKGKIYAIGGRGTDNKCCIGDDFIDYIECLDYNNNMIWEKVPLNNYTYYGDLSISLLLNRSDLGACSFGDEIFVFDGSNGDDSNQARCSAFAFNPETKVIRKIKDPVSDSGDGLRLAPCAAVPLGSKIYLFGRKLDSSTPSDHSYHMLEYTP